MQKKYNIILEKGEASKSIFEMSNEEILEVGNRILKIVTEKAARTGNKPVIREVRKVTH